MEQRSCKYLAFLEGFFFSHDHQWQLVKAAAGTRAMGPAGSQAFNPLSNLPTRRLKINQNTLGQLLQRVRSLPQETGSSHFA